MKKQIVAPTTQTKMGSGRSGILQRQCACGTHSVAGGDCKACDKKKEATALQRSAVTNEPMNEAPPIVHDVLRSSGQLLDQPTRSLMELRFGHNFSHVRVHTGAKAVESARSVNALAYTVGHDIVFNAGQYSPGTAAGQRVLAHELTHVVQQSDDLQIPLNRLEITGPTHSSEREAETISNLVSESAPIVMNKVANGCLTPRIARKSEPGTPEQMYSGSSSSRVVVITFGPGQVTPGGGGESGFMENSHNVNALEDAWTMIAQLVHGTVEIEGGATNNPIGDAIKVAASRADVVWHEINDRSEGMQLIGGVKGHQVESLEDMIQEGRITVTLKPSFNDSSPPTNFLREDKAKVRVI